MTNLKYSLLYIILAASSLPVMLAAKGPLSKTRSRITRYIPGTIAHQQRKDKLRIKKLDKEEMQLGRANTMDREQRIDQIKQIQAKKSELEKQIKDNKYQSTWKFKTVRHSKPSQVAGSLAETGQQMVSDQARNTWRNRIKPTTKKFRTTETSLKSRWNSAKRSGGKVIDSIAPHMPGHTGRKRKSDIKRYEQNISDMQAALANPRTPESMKTRIREQGLPQFQQLLETTKAEQQASTRFGGLRSFGKSIREKVVPALPGVKAYEQYKLERKATEKDRAELREIGQKLSKPAELSVIYGKAQPKIFSAGERERLENRAAVLRGNIRATERGLKSKSRPLQ